MWLNCKTELGDVALAPILPILKLHSLTNCQEFKTYFFISFFPLNDLKNATMKLSISAKVILKTTSRSLLISIGTSFISVEQTRNLVTMHEKKNFASL